MLIRPACAADAPAVSAIYDHYAVHTTVTFAEHAPGAAHYADQMKAGIYPFFAAEEEGQLVGFAYASPFRLKDAYRWDVEATIYVRPGFTGRGTGVLLMQALLNALKRQGYLNVYSCITIPNEPSVRLHEKCGFESLGMFPDTGYKLGKWRSVLWMQRRLGVCEDKPQEPVPFSQILRETV